MKVFLYRVGRNLNRAYRTCEAFGVFRLELLDCNAKIGGNLYKAAGRVEVVRVYEWPSPGGALALETFYADSIYHVAWDMVETIIIGGETTGLPRSFQAQQTARIPMVGHVSGLTVEAALAVALYEWQRVISSTNNVR